MATVNEDTLKKMSKDGNYSMKFEEGRRARIELSTFKYGNAKINFGRGYVSALGSLKKCLEKYEETHNTEYLMDAANYAMFEFMYPSIEGATFTPTDSNGSAGIDGMSVKEMEALKDEDSTYLSC